MHTQFLSRVLMADAVVSGAAGVVMIIGADFLAPLLNLPAGLLQIAGFALIPWFIALIALGRSANVSRGAVLAVIAVNVAWVIGSIAVLFVFQPNLFGYALVIAQAVAVGVFAELQIVALKRYAKTA